MHAIGNQIKETFPSFKIVYVTSETFTYELIQSIQENTNAQFRNKYRNVDVLMVDDIQFISGKVFHPGGNFSIPSTPCNQRQADRSSARISPPWKC